MPPLMRQTGHEDMTMGEGNGDVSVTYELLLISCRMFFVAVTGFVRDVIQFLHHPHPNPTDQRFVGFLFRRVRWDSPACRACRNKGVHGVCSGPFVLVSEPRTGIWATIWAT